MKPSGPGDLFFGRFLITASISVLVIGVFIISISSWFNLGRLNLSMNLSFLPGYPFYCHTVVHNSLYNPLYFCIVCCNLSFFISNLVDFIRFFSLLFSMSWAKGMSILFIFSKNQLSVFFFSFINHYYSFFHFFLPNLYDFFPSNNFGVFFLLFPVVLGIKLGCLFSVFIVSLGRIVLL